MNMRYARDTHTDAYMACPASKQRIPSVLPSANATSERLTRVSARFDWLAIRKSDQLARSNRHVILIARDERNWRRRE